MQVAWAKTKRIGCGIAHCPNGNFEYYVVCEYYPGGNYNNEYPYVSSTENCTTCAAMGYQCGEYKDSCGNNVTCNSCKTNERCENHMCVCYPKTQCEENDCGVVSDGCNGTITCGKCKYSGQECNAKGKCVCVNRKTCYKFGKNCGWMDDGCGGSYWCNSTSYGCSSDFTCRDNVCTCKNGTTCADLGYECGVTENGCGKNITCGFCTGRRTCVNHTCVLTYVGPDDPDEPGSSGSMAPGLCASVAALVLALVATLL